MPVGSVGVEEGRVSVRTIETRARAWRGCCRDADRGGLRARRPSARAGFEKNVLPDRPALRFAVAGLRQSGRSERHPEAALPPRKAGSGIPICRSRTSTRSVRSPTGRGPTAPSRGGSAAAGADLGRPMADGALFHRRGRRHDRRQLGRAVVRGRRRPQLGLQPRLPGGRPVTLRQRARRRPSIRRRGGLIARWPRSRSIAILFLTCSRS